MDTSLTVEYDKVNDILHLGKTKAYSEQDSEELDYGVIARLNPQTHDLENLEILFFSSRVAKGDTFQLPVTAEFRLPKAGSGGIDSPRLMDSSPIPLTAWRFPEIFY